MLPPVDTIQRILKFTHAVGCSKATIPPTPGQHPLANYLVAPHWLSYVIDPFTGSVVYADIGNFSKYESRFGFSGYLYDVVSETQFVKQDPDTKTCDIHIVGKLYIWIKEESMLSLAVQAMGKLRPVDIRFINDNPNEALTLYPLRVYANPIKLSYSYMKERIISTLGLQPCLTRGIVLIIPMFRIVIYHTGDIDGLSKMKIMGSTRLLSSSFFYPLGRDGMTSNPRRNYQGSLSSQICITNENIFLVHYNRPLLDPEQLFLSAYQSIVNPTHASTWKLQ